MSTFWKSPRPEIEASEHFSYEDDPVQVIPDHVVPETVTRRTLVKGLASVDQGVVEVSTKPSYDQDKISAIVKAWLTR
jgi:hypothetical protein